MKFIAILITNNIATCVGVYPRHKVVLFVFLPDRTATYNARTGLLEKTSIDSSTSCHDWDIWEQRYEYDEKGRLTATSLSSHDSSYTYDDAGRVTGYVLANYNTPIVDNTYIYGTNGTYATNRLIEIKNNNYKNVGSTYTYNAQGYVTGYTTDRNWYNDYTYTYDTLGRLTSETYNGETFTYTYDNKNNVQKSGLTYTNGKLTSVDGKAIVYDAMGNPTTYKGKAFTWTQGRKLASGNMNGNSFTYDYDGNGMRYEKTVNGKKTEYYWNGTQLLFEYRQELGERVYYIYDASGVAGILYKNNVYYFAKNAFGDIVAIFNRAGEQVAEYVYDAWGNIIYENYDYSDNIGEINPFRYRGYYYDTETGFYYLQTRYYDPETMRFINADNYELVGSLASVPGQLNLYAYANNNPIMYTDETGESILLSLLATYVTANATAIALFGVPATISDTVHLFKLEISEPENGSFNIVGSQNIITPWVQFAYSFYLNHFDPRTKDIIKGSTLGVQGEWATHNMVYYGSKIIDYGLSVVGKDSPTINSYIIDSGTLGLGATVFNNNDKKMIGMATYNFITRPFFTIADWYIYHRGY